MKTMILFLATSIFTMTGFAQNVVNPYPKTISVNGSAELEIVPDEIYVQVDVKEYEKKGQGKVTIDKNTAAVFNCYKVDGFARFIFKHCRL